MEITDYKNIHFVGIGGISMSGLAEILKTNDYTITGSDGKASDITAHLIETGIDVKIGHSESNISDDCELVVYTAAVSKDNCELAEARRKGLPVIERAVLLGLMMKHYDHPLCIAGTHGKTTTTSMVSEIFLAAETDPTIMLGGILNSIGGNFRTGSDKYFIAESCEYCDSFLSFYPDTAIILNIDRDHTDYFETLEDTYNSFRKFASLISLSGSLIINSSIPDYEKITQGLKCNVITYGEKGSAKWYPSNIRYDANGCGSFEIMCDELKIAEVTLKVPGVHNVYNAVAACIMADIYGISIENIEKGLANFSGTHRRFEEKGKYKGALIIDDYAHHPTEIKAALSAAKAHDVKRIIAVFQPHTYTRTKSLLTEFSQAFDDADEIILLDIYAAREKNLGEVHSKDLQRLLSERGRECKYMNSFESAEDYIKQELKAGDMLITIGAGDVYKIADDILSQQ